MKVLSLCRLNYKKYILELVLFVILVFALFVPNLFTRYVVAIFLIIYTVITTRLCKKKETTSINNKKVIIQMIIFGLIYVAGYYILGLYFEYYKNVVQFNLNTIITFIIPFTLIIITSEILRNRFVSENDRISNILTTLIMVLIELVLYWQAYNISQLKDFLTVFGLIILASIACNLLYNYICTRFSYKSIIVYRLITVLYLYILPIVPDVDTFFRAVLRMIYPYIIYLFLESVYAKDKTITTYGIKKAKALKSIIVIFVGIFLTMIISCKFYVGVIAIGSGSMANTINTGDAVVFTKYTNQDITVGDIVLFEKNNSIIIHRVIDIENSDNIKKYYTKGDNNNTVDEGYITSSEIVGTYKFRIKYIGYPSLWLSDIF